MSGFQLLFLTFLLVPVIEIYLLVKVGSLIGAGWTIFLVVFTAVVGAWLVRLQGLGAMARVQNTLQRGEMPAMEMLEGMMIFLAGALLITPGFFTDTIGFLLLIAPLRRKLALALLKRGIIRPVGGGPHGPGGADGSKPGAGHGPRTLEGEYKEVDE